MSLLPLSPAGTSSIEDPKNLNLYKKILGIMRDLSYVQKTSKVGGLYSYASHDQVTAKIHPLLVKWGIIVIPTIEEMTQNGNRTEAKVSVYFINVDSPSENFHVTFYGYGIDTSDKGPGKAISYAYKYALLKTFCLETGDDPDEDQECTHEPPKCQDFDFKLPQDLSDEDRAYMNAYLDFSSKTMNRHVEDVKRDAANRMPEFLNAFKLWRKRCTT